MWICSYGVVNCPECKRTGEEITELQSADDRIYFRIRYADKEDAKQMGCRWDPDRRLWYSLLRNEKLVDIGKRWRVVSTMPPATTPKPQASVSSPAAGRNPKAQYSLEDLLGAPTLASVEPEPKPGSIPYEEFMAAIRAADEADAAGRQADPQERIQGAIARPMQSKGA